MKTPADILRELGKLGPYTTEKPPEPAAEKPTRKRPPREPLPPVDF